jgi:hypothetical protein
MICEVITSGSVLIIIPLLTLALMDVIQNLRLEMDDVQFAWMAVPIPLPSVVLRQKITM